MAGSRFERLFGDLDAEFEAALVREEDEAATDLARALRQDIDLQLAVSRGAWTAHIPGGLSAPLVEIGKDYIVAGSSGVSLVVPRHLVVLTPDEEGVRARASGRDLLVLLRDLTRRRADLEVATDQGRFRGQLLRATPDHLLLQGPDREVVIPLEAVREVRLVFG